jgi:hypothetical protein
MLDDRSGAARRTTRPAPSDTGLVAQTAPPDLLDGLPVRSATTEAAKGAKPTGSGSPKYFDTLRSNGAALTAWRPYQRT